MQTFNDGTIECYQGHDDEPAYMVRRENDCFVVSENSGRNPPMLHGVLDGSICQYLPHHGLSCETEKLVSGRKGRLALIAFAEERYGAKVARCSFCQRCDRI